MFTYIFIYAILLVHNIHCTLAKKGVMCMLTKKDCYDYILSVKPYVNLSSVCRALNISRTSLMIFLTKYESHNYVLSVENLNRVCNFIQDM